MKAAVVVIVIVQPAFRVFARCRSGLRRWRFGGTCGINLARGNGYGRKIFSMLSGWSLWPTGEVKREVLLPGEYEQRKGKVPRMILSGAPSFTV
jgi:hypothetical protein